MKSKSPTGRMTEASKMAILEDFLIIVLSFWTVITCARNPMVLGVCYIVRWMKMEMKYTIWYFATLFISLPKVIASEHKRVNIRSNGLVTDWSKKWLLFWYKFTFSEKWRSELSIISCRYYCWWWTSARQSWRREAGTSLSRFRLLDCWWLAFDAPNFGQTAGCKVYRTCTEVNAYSPGVSISETVYTNLTRSYARLFRMKSNISRFCKQYFEH